MSAPSTEQPLDLSRVAVGHIVHIVWGTDGRLNERNGQGNQMRPGDVEAAVIVRDWRTGTVNLLALPDAPKPVWVTSVAHESLVPDGATFWRFPVPEAVRR